MEDGQETVLSEEEEWQDFVHLFFEAATFQGRLAYFLMSFYACNPEGFNSTLGFDIYPYLWSNMIYGISMMIFHRPTLRSISVINRIAFAVLGSLMFNHASMTCFNWIYRNYPDRPYLRAFFGFMSGRVMMVHFLAFMYHMDTRTYTPGVTVQRDIAFEQMYNRPTALER